MERTRLGVFFFLLILLASGMVKESEGRHCESKSHRFRGACWSDTNCASVCRSEGYMDGDCRGLRRRCFCIRLC